MKFNEFPFVRYTVFFVSGVLLYPHLGPLEPSPFFIYLLLSWAVFTVLSAAYRPAFRKPYYFVMPVLAYASLFLAGIWVAAINDVNNDPQHLFHQEDISGYLAEVKELDQQKARSIGNLLEVSAIETTTGWKGANGKIQVYHRSDKALEPGTVLLVSGAPQRISPPKNPETFDYAAFMAGKQIYFSHFIDTAFIVLGKEELSVWYGGILKLRQYLELKIAEYVQDEAAVQIAKALLLGQKADLDEEIGEAYATAGAMHILAVSGLHVGIIYGFFFLFFKPHQMRGYKRAVFLAMVVVLIWFYAAITGLSPSVLRAATMFTFISMAQIKSRNPSIFNPLALSALVLLVYDPFLVYAVGFQLSYTALLGILLFQPMIAKLWYPEEKWLNYLWDIITVGIAAQLATFPLAIHYFNVFPTYFMLSNLLAIPGAFVIMSLGIPFLLFSAFPLLATGMGYLLDVALQLLNAGIFSLQHLPFAKIDQIYFQLPEMILIWAFLFFVYLLVETRKKPVLILVFVTLFLLSGFRVYKTFLKINQNYLVIYRLEGGMALDYTYRGNLYSMAWQVKPDEFNYEILPHRIKVTGTSGKFLVVRDKGSLLYLELPCGRRLTLDKDSRLPTDGRELEMHLWEAGNWQVFDPTDMPTALPQAAIKISFNNRRPFL
ncbi:ComEC/Rec2 family competence protein [Cyclobacterium plantarum]|uniref:ComEC family competence protein n=1 Tax=Cyclobacterium plantarum TaxID=2716263 RepID=A0ABX0H5Y1_9BACT|nr:ComEC/Rec2 family competence protein [Cyclobacterium plantarum]NHE55666.1 ComEC family competence protein [Cyclobacterium plantarum]